jgi:hypothetical protein
MPVSGVLRDLTLDFPRGTTENAILGPLKGQSVAIQSSARVDIRIVPGIQSTYGDFRRFHASDLDRSHSRDGEPGDAGRLAFGDGGVRAGGDRLRPPVPRTIGGFFVTAVQPEA